MIAVTRSPWVFWVIASFITLTVKYYFFYDTSGDYKVFLLPWYGFMQVHGWKAFAEDFTNYTPFYLYFLKIGQSLAPSAPAWVVVKVITYVGEVLAAGLAYRMVREIYPHGLRPSFAFFGILLSPAVLIEDSGTQCDIFNVLFSLMCIYCYYKKRAWLAMFCFGLAVSFKLISIFIAPLLGIFIIQKRIPVSAIVMVPVAYLLMILPCFLLGRPLDDLLIIYFRQFHYYQSLSKSAPNYYLLIPSSYYSLAVPAGIMAGIIAGFVIVYIGVTRKLIFSLEALLATSAMCSLVFPFILPKMHDRYFFAADIIMLVLCVINPAYVKAAILLAISFVLSNEEFITVTWLGYMRMLSLSAAVMCNIAVMIKIIPKWRIYLQPKHKANPPVLTN